jgi:hypothetical protein
MALIFADLVQETTATTGTGTLNLAGAVAQFQSFVTGIGSGNTCYYTLLSGNATDWEIGIGTVTSGSPNTLARTTVLKSSNSNAAISLSGTSNVFCSVPAEFMVNAQLSRYVAKTTTYTAAAGDQILADTSSAAWTLTLPSSPAVNDTIGIVDALQCFDVHNLTVSPNGGKIQGISTNNLVLSDACANAVLTYTGSTYGWIVSLSRSIPSTTTWNVNNQATSHLSAFEIINYRRLLAIPCGQIGNCGIKSTTSRSSGKQYFEYKAETVGGTYGVMLGVATSSTSNNSYPGGDSSSFSIVTANGKLYNSGSNTSTVATFAAGDVLGVALDFTASTGSVKFYKNSSLLYTYSSLTLGSMFIMAVLGGTNLMAERGLLCTTSQQCAYSPPAGYSYWDN